MHLSITKPRAIAITYGVVSTYLLVKKYNSLNREISELSTRIAQKKLKIQDLQGTIRQLVHEKKVAKEKEVQAVIDLAEAQGEVDRLSVRLEGAEELIYEFQEREKVLSEPEIVDDDLGDLAGLGYPQSLGYGTLVGGDEVSDPPPVAPPLEQR